MEDNESVLEELFGKTPRTAILSAFSDGIGEAWSKKEIQEMTGLSKATILNNWTPLEKYAIIKVKKQVGNTKVYTLNMDNEATKLLLKLENELANCVAPKNKKCSEKELIPA
jgi:predicted transcriptional regulator